MPRASVAREQESALGQPALPLRPGSAACELGKRGGLRSQDAALFETTCGKNNLSPPAWKPFPFWL